MSILTVGLYVLMAMMIAAYLAAIAIHAFWDGPWAMRMGEWKGVLSLVIYTVMALMLLSFGKDNLNPKEHGSRLVSVLSFVAAGLIVIDIALKVRRARKRRPESE